MTSEQIVRKSLSGKWPMLIILTGMSLSLIQYLYNRSIWGDEAMLAMNIIQRNASALLLPLDYDQVAPILFLMLEKATSVIIPNSELGLRLIPLLSFWISMLLFRQLSKQFLRNPTAQIIALSLFAINATLIYYSSEVKQYMTDVMVATGCLYIVTATYSKPYFKLVIFTVCGMLSIWLSNAAPIILSTCGLWLYLNTDKSVKSFFGLLLSAFFIGAVFLYYYFWFIHNHPAQQFMLDVWLASNAFMPLNPFSSEFLCFFEEFTKEMFFSTLRFKALGIILFGLYVTGCYNLVKNKKIKILLVLIFPIILHLALSALHLYPAAKRLMLYTTPVMLIMIGFGVEMLAKWPLFQSQLENKIKLYYTFPLLLLGIIFVISFPQKREEIKPNIEYLNKHIQPGDEIYVHRMAAFAFMYYEKIGYFNAPNNIRYGSFQPTDAAVYVKEMTAIPARTWLVTTSNPRSEIHKMLKMLDTSGKKPLTSTAAYKSKIFEFDLRP